MEVRHRNAKRGFEDTNLNNTIGSVVVRDCIYNTNNRYTVGERKRSSSKVSSKRRELWCV